MTFRYDVYVRDTLKVCSTDVKYVEDVLKRAADKRGMTIRSVIPVNGTIFTIVKIYISNNQNPEQEI